MKPTRTLRKVLAWMSLAAAGLSSHAAVSSNAAPVAVTNAPADKASAPEARPTALLDARALARKVADRNIFDPDRQPRVRGESRPQTRPKPVVPADAPELGLVGVLRFERGTFAFFDGNAPEYRKTLQVDAVIAGHTVGAITPQSVTLSESNRPPVQLRVGQRLRKDSEGAWQLVAAAGADGFSRSSGSSGGSNAGGGATAAASATTTTTTTEDPPGSDEILKRLLKKREQEMK
jgi:hypothetical protein